MPASDPHRPADYEALIRLIHERYEGMSKTHQAISVYLTQNPNEVAVNSVNAIAGRCGVHASNFVRFAQTLGYRGFKDVQQLFQMRLETAAPGFEARVRALETELGGRDRRTDFDFLRELVVTDIASLQELLEQTTDSDLADAADLLQEADTVFLVGQLRSAPVVELLRYMLTMIGKKCVLLDPSGGLATHMARTMTTRDVLVAVSFRYYATEVVGVTEQAVADEVPVIAISDSSLSPIAKSSRVLFAVPEHRHTFSRSLGAPMCVAQAIILATASRMREFDGSPKIPTVTES